MIRSIAGRALWASVLLFVCLPSFGAQYVVGSNKDIRPNTIMDSVVNAHAGIKPTKLAEYDPTGQPYHFYPASDGAGHITWIGTSLPFLPLAGGTMLGDILAQDTTVDLGSVSLPFGKIFVDQAYLQPSLSDPTGLHITMPSGTSGNAIDVQNTSGTGPSSWFLVTSDGTVHMGDDLRLYDPAGLTTATDVLAGSATPNGNATANPGSLYMRTNGELWIKASGTGNTGWVMAGTGSGSVTSVAQTVPVEFTISGSPITTSGTLAIGKATETAHTAWLGPNGGSPAVPTFRALVEGDLPTLPATPGTYTNATVTIGPTGYVENVTNGSGGTGDKIVTYHIAADDSSSDEKAQANFVCNSTDAQSCFGDMQAAAIMAGYAGIDVKASEGTYTWGTNSVTTYGRRLTLTLPMRIWGAGRGTHFVRGFDESTSGNAILTLGDGSTTTSGFEITGVWFDHKSGGDGSTNDNWITINDKVQDSSIHDCWFGASGGWNIKDDSTLGGIRIQNNWSDGSSISYFYTNSTGVNRTVTGNTVLNGNFGIKVSAPRSVIANNVVDGPGADGFEVNGDYSNVTGNLSANTTAAGYALAGSHISLIGNRARNNATNSLNVSSGTGNFIADNAIDGTIHDGGTSTIFIGQYDGSANLITQGAGIQFPTGAHTGYCWVDQGSGVGGWASCTGGTVGVAGGGTGATSFATDHLIGSDSSSSTGPLKAITVGSGLLMAANTLSATASGGSGASMPLLESHTASTSTSLDFTACISGTYDQYVVELINLIPATNNTDLQMEVSTDGGTTWDTTSGHYVWSVWRWVNSTGGASGSTSAAAMSLTGALTAVSNTTADGGVSGTYKIFNPGNSSSYKRMTGQAAYNATSGFQELGITTQGSYIQTAAFNAFRIKATSGNLTSGVVRCYGIAH